METASHLIKKDYLGKEPISSYPDGSPYYYGEKVKFKTESYVSTNPSDYSIEIQEGLGPIGYDKDGPIYFGDDGSRNLTLEDLKLQLKDGSYEKEVVDILSMNNTVDDERFMRSEQLAYEYCERRSKGLDHKEARKEVIALCVNINMVSSGEHFIKHLPGDPETKPALNHITNKKEFMNGMALINFANDEINKSMTSVRNIFKSYDQKLKEGINRADKVIFSGKSQTLEIDSNIKTLVEKIQSKQLRYKITELTRLNIKMSNKMKKQNSDKKIPKENLHVKNEVKELGMFNKKSNQDKGFSMGM